MLYKGCHGSHSSGCSTLWYIIWHILSHGCYWWKVQYILEHHCCCGWAFSHSSLQGEIMYPSRVCCEISSITTLVYRQSGPSNSLLKLNQNPWQVSWDISSPRVMKSSWSSVLSHSPCTLQEMYPSLWGSPGRLSQNGVSGSHFQNQLADTVVCMLEWLSCHKSRYPFACVDFWQLNESVLRETHPLPKVDYTLAQLSGAMAFSTLDANSDF